MVRFIQRSYQLPSVEAFKQILYDNDVGYKVVDGKLYVRRFYKIPLLLFPEETMMRRSPADKGRYAFGLGRADLLRDMGNFSRSDDTLAEIRDRMSSVGGHFSEPRISTSKGGNLVEDDGDYLEGEGGLALEKPSEEVIVDIEAEGEPQKPELEVGSPEWNAALDRCNIKVPTTVLERDRDALFSGRYDSYKLEESTSEVELYQYRRTRYALFI